jgi:hypothetical protein
MALKKRHKVIDPRKARAATQGGLLNYAAPYPSPEKTCAACQLPRYSVNATGICGPCRVKMFAVKPGVSDG